MSDPFVIDAMATRLLADPAPYRAAFDRQPALLFDTPFAPDMLATLMTVSEGGLARPAGFEPATGRVEVGNSIQLSYGRVSAL